ncbi:MAG: DUF883 family protein [Hydrogenophaga sp.]|uniref:DUF883 family protein n=1 Tax=Hydrogenophaga sp. TaxID=1904254 RepID=UPI0016A62EE6|nr:DUF883 C-terminal domain-containing protein [Hydrogenophaga sp.]NIM41120.1 DUF883 family protein [Hydrogenophaga sp.]NIN26436.1 DUF883 family protein [Hydrogenophaga sp.]NIN31311.1 DUF883 family protein [Hydrogenophaga sp.]NIN55366.1 DUF883 family protein [Hydrogenophaga sp.]NIO51701.1 DUF883 family protein [Hydrogenophaga sp.]
MSTNDPQATNPFPEAGEKLAQASGALHEHARQWRGVQEEWTECVRITVRENPLGAVGTALAVGALFGLLCARR